jgi:hypothetical protein
MKQLTTAAVGFERYTKTTRRAAFLAEMERVVPWSALCAGSLARSGIAPEHIAGSGPKLPRTGR